jgi:phage shock protein PspC (stress-responsive transcriptional regulator)
MNTQAKRLYRPTGDRKIAGVCSGLGEHFEIDPIIFRLCFLFSIFFGGLGILIYVVMWILVPSRDSSPDEIRSTVRLHLSNTERMIAGVCGGLAESAALDPVLIRVGFVVVAFACGFGILLYLALWLLLPRAPGAVPAAPAAPSNSATA